MKHSKKIATLATICVSVSLWVAPSSASSASALNLLGQVTISAESNSSSYNRYDFNHWTDQDGDGCDTRQEVLIAESRKPLDVFGKCKFLEGDWLSLFDNVVITDPSKIDIDHFVPLKEAWESGASKWTREQREAFANDLDFAGSLIAVSASSNRSKGDRDPAQWLPRNSRFVCEYAVTWVQVKIRWSLSVDKSEETALRKALGTCSKSKTYAIPEKSSSSKTPSPSPSPSKTEAPTPTQAPSPQPSQSSTPTPTQTTTPTPTPTQDSSLPVIRAGAFCAKELEGTQGRSSNGTIYTCKTSSTDSRLRWRQ